MLEKLSSGEELGHPFGQTIEEDLQEVISETHVEEKSKVSSIFTTLLFLWLPSELISIQLGFWRFRPNCF